jgi:hypothetical protein
VRFRGWSLGLLVLAWTGLAATGCLPRGDPPAGRQVIADRTLLLADVLPAAPDGTLRVVVARLRSEPFLADLYLVSAPADGSPPSERLLAESLAWGVGCPASPCFPADARGRLFLRGGYDPNFGTNTLIRVDPATGDRTDFGPQSEFHLSPSRERLVTTTFDNNNGLNTVTLYEADDRAVSLPGVSYAQFAGEALFYLTADQQLMRVLPNAAPELVRADVDGFYTQPGEAEPLLFVFTSSNDPASIALTTLVDPVTLQDLSAPFQGNATPSPDGRWLALQRYDPATGTQEMVLVEAASGAEERIETAGYVVNGFNWRPGHTELWAPLYPMTYDGNMYVPRTLIKRPGQPALEIPVFVYGYGNLVVQSFFTPDGAYWFSSGPSETQNRFTVEVGSADDPTGPTFVLNPEGTSSYSYHALGDGRLMVEAFRTVPERSDVYAVDPTTGTSRLLGEQGVVLAAGAWRALANLHRVDGRGDLTVIDVETDRATVLAYEFTQAALVERGAASDVVAPGARVVFNFLARFDSPYDGIWVATLP